MAWFTQANMNAQILKNKMVYRKLERDLAKIDGLTNRVNFCRDAAYILSRCSSTYFSAPFIEDVCCEYAESCNVPLSSTFTQNSVLHVLSEAYETGGHTRVVERWISLADRGEKHSVALTRATYPEALPELMRQTSLHGGSIVKIDGEDILTKALNLRKLASTFELVVLHTHMDDIVPLVAFGTEMFQRPIFLFNHADHRFWVGVSITDVVINFRAWGEMVASNYRGVTNSVMVSLPQCCEKEQSHLDTFLFRKANGIPENAKIVFSSGPRPKYRPLLDYDFSIFMERLLLRRDDIVFVIVGVGEKKLPNWGSIPQERLITLDSMPYGQFLEWLLCSDIVVDSFPISGGTAVMDAVLHGKPVVSLASPLGQLDYLAESPASVYSYDELLDLVEKLIDSPSHAALHAQLTLDALIRESSVATWREKLALLKENFTQHRVTPFSTCAKPVDEIDYSLYRSLTKAQRVIRFPKIGGLYRVKQGGVKKYKFSWEFLSEL